MPQEISISHLAIKSKVYRLIDALVDGDKTEADVKESIRRWWELIPHADRPLARKYLLTVVGRSVSALDAIEYGLTSSSSCAATREPLPSGRMKVIEPIVKEATAHSAV